jgi:hypothetical protein
MTELEYFHHREHGEKQENSVLVGTACPHLRSPSYAATPYESDFVVAKTLSRWDAKTLKRWDAKPHPVTNH